MGTGSNVLIAGFVISGNTPETVLIRGIGPTLGQFGVTGSLAAPELVLYDSGNNTLQTNSGWGGGANLVQAFASVGAFSLAANSADAAILVTLPPGAYTAEVSGVNGATGVGPGRGLRGPVILGCRGRPAAGFPAAGSRRVRRP